MEPTVFDLSSPTDKNSSDYWEKFYSQLTDEFNLIIVNKPENLTYLDQYNELSSLNDEDIVISASKQRFDKVVYLVSIKKVNVDLENESGDTALQYAASGKNLDLVRYLVEKGADINTRGFYDGTPLMGASSKGNLDIVEYLVKKDSDVNLQDAVEGWTALIFASMNGHLNVVKYLVKNGARNLCDYEGRTAAIHAAKNEHRDVVEYFNKLKEIIRKRKKT